MAAKGELDKTILYTTDNNLTPYLDEACRWWLLENSCGCEIVSVSQKPINFGRNICVGDIGRSGISIDIQLLEGLKTINTEWVMVAEHDCIYSKDHVRWIPPDDVYFYYNVNMWIGQYDHQEDRPKHHRYNGIFSHIEGRMVQSQMVCNTKRYMEAMTLKNAITTHPAWRSLYPSGRIAEPGCSDKMRTRKLTRRAVVRKLTNRVQAYLDRYEAKSFVTEVPNIDIRHRTNFTGMRRGRGLTRTLSHWGTLDEILKRGHDGS
jgi:hypothetical protein